MSADDRAHVELEERFRRDLAALPIPREERWLPAARGRSRIAQLAILVPLAVIVIVAGLLAGELLRQRRTPDTLPPAASPSATATPTPTAAGDRTPPDVANLALSTRARDAGRTDVAVCLYVDPASGLSDANAALASLQGSIDALVREGYTVLGTRPASLCPQAPLFIRTGTVHPKNSGARPVAPVPTVTTASEFQLYFVVTSSTRIDEIFGSLSSHRGTEESACQGNLCVGVTDSIYADPISFGSDSERERLLLEGFGLLRPR